MAPREFDDVAHWLNHAGLVVGKHDRDQRRRGAHQLVLERRQIDAPRGIHENTPRVRHRRQHRLVLDRRDRDRTAHAAQCLIVCLGAAARKHHLRGCGSDHHRHLRARVLESATRLAPETMHRGRIAHTLKNIAHGIDHGRPDRRGCIVVEIAEPAHGFARRRRDGRMTVRVVRRRRCGVLRPGSRAPARWGAPAAPPAPSVPPPAGSADRWPATLDRS